MYGRISSSLPYHTRAGPTRIPSICNTQIQVIPYSKSVDLPYCCTVLYPNFTKTFPYLTHNPLLTCPNLAIPHSPYQYQCEMGYSMVECDGIGLHNYYELVTGMLNVLYVIS